MGYTMAQKIIASHCGKEDVVPGEIVVCKTDYIVAGEASAHMCFVEFEKLENPSMFDKEKLVIVPDHTSPAPTIANAMQNKEIRLFCRKHELPHYYEVGQMGIEHVIMPEKGFVAPGELICGCDSHSCTYGALGAFAPGISSTDMLLGMTLGEMWLKVPETIKITFRGKLPPYISGKDLILYTLGQIGMDGARYKVIEFCGDPVYELPMEGRFTLCNMAIEAGAKSAIIPPDEVALNYAKERCQRPFTPVYPDADAVYVEEYEWDISSLEPQVAIPPEPDRVFSVREAIKKKGDIYINQGFIGSCTNGRLDDLRVAARILDGKRVNPEVRLIVIPGSQEVYMNALKEGIIEKLIAAGAAVSTPTCGPCVGAHMGLLAKGEVCVSSSNRNFPGRMGHFESEVYLASPAVVAASAILGKLAVPEEVK